MWEIHREAPASLRRGPPNSSVGTPPPFPCYTPSTTCWGGEVNRDSWTPEPGQQEVPKQPSGWSFQTLASNGSPEGRVSIHPRVHTANIYRMKERLDLISWTLKWNHSYCSSGPCSRCLHTLEFTPVWGALSMRPRLRYRAVVTVSLGTELQINRGQAFSGVALKANKIKWRFQRK